MKRFFLRALFFVGATIYYQACLCFDLNHFFEASFAPQEPFFEKENLTSLSFRAGTGFTHIKTDGCGVPICNSPPNSYKVSRFMLDAGYNYHKNLFVHATLPGYLIKVTEGGIHHEFNSLGNLVVTTGWTINYQETEKLDFIDATIETGLIVPTAKYPLAAAGIPIRAVAALGFWDWTTLGIATDIVAFFTHEYGRLSDTSIYFKGDHFIRGFSFLFGYTHSNEKQVPVVWSCPIKHIPFWTMDTFNILLSYDCASENRPYLPRFEFFYNKVVTGENIVKTPLWGFTLAMDF